MRRPIFPHACVNAGRRRIAVGLTLAAPLLATLWLAGCASLGPHGWGLQSPPPSRQPLELDPSAREAVAAQALLQVNTPYHYGGNSPEGGFDCSGLVSYVFAQALPRDAWRLPRDTAQWAAVTVPVSQPQRGDLVFFGGGGSFSHMGIYVGDGQFVHAPSRGGQVRKDSLQSRYFSTHYRGVRRAFADGP